MYKVVSCLQMLFRCFHYQPSASQARNGEKKTDENSQFPLFPTPTPLRLWSVNPPQFLFPYARLEDP